METTELFRIEPCAKPDGWFTVFYKDKPVIQASSWVHCTKFVDDCKRDMNERGPDAVEQSRQVWRQLNAAMTRTRRVTMVS